MDAEADASRKRCSSPLCQGKTSTSRPRFKSFDPFGSQMASTKLQPLRIRPVSALAWSVLLTNAARIIC